MNRNHLRPIFTFAAFAAAAMLLAPAQADESSRRRLREEIDRLLSDMAGELRDVPGDSGTSDLERTIDYAGRVAEKARDLKNDADTDSDAKRIGETYPDIASRYRDAARYLRDMKQQQRRNDEWQRRCEDKGRELAEKLRAFTDNPDPRGLDEIPRLARDLGRTGKDGLEQAERLRNEMAGWHERVRYFGDSDGRWNDVRSNLHSASATMLEYVQKQQEQLKRDDVCGDLSKEERNPRVEAALRKLSEGKKGIELLYEAMDRQLSEIASYLDRLEGDSNDSDIASAESKLGELERNLEQLDRVKGQDGEARRRLELYRTIAREARTAWRELRTLKQSQFVADKAPEKCKELAARLDEIIKRYVDAQDVDGRDEIPARAREFAEPIKAGLAKTDEQHPVMERALSDLNRFDPGEGRWRDVRDRQRASAAAIFEHWKRAREAAHSACDDLAKGGENPAVRRALAKLQDQASQTEGDLTKAIDAWVEKARTTYKLDCQAMQDMWEAYCGTDWEPNDSEPGDRPKQTAAYLQDKMQSAMGPALQELPALQKRVDALLAKRETKRQGEGLAARLDKERKRLERLSVSNVWHGNNDPIRGYATEYGNQQHASLHSSFGCKVPIGPGKRARFPGSGHTDPDCIVPDKCEVWEFKPDSPSGRVEGKAQKDSYERIVPKYYTELHRDGKTPSDDLGGADVMKVLQSKCLSGTAIQLKVDVHYYKMCEKRYVCISD